MKIWALSDPHLAWGVPSKSMEAFGPPWLHYTEKIAQHWKQTISPEDLVLIPGDISWAMNLEQARPDLCWLDALPGSKILLRGNHDYWWSSASKLAHVMPPSIRFIHNNALIWNGIAIGGSRLWDTREYTFNTYITFRNNPFAPEKTQEERQRALEEGEKIFARELERLKLSLSQLDPHARVRIALTHYPPIGPDLSPSRASAILEQFKIDYCVFGHLHSVKKDSLPFGTARGVKYRLTSCDYIDFTPLPIWP